MSLYSLCVFFLVTFLMGFLWQSALAAAGYQCYICSWSPRDSNRTDNCTDENFDPRNVHSDTCEFGCEVYVQWDPNGSLDQWRRNCVRKSSEMTGNCQNDQTVAWLRKRCTCSSDYCNSATSGRISLVALLPMALVVALPLKRLL